MDCRVGFTHLYIGLSSATACRARSENRKNRVTFGNLARLVYLAPGVLVPIRAASRALRLSDGAAAVAKHASFERRIRFAEQSGLRREACAYCAAYLCAPTMAMASIEQVARMSEAMCGVTCGKVGRISLRSSGRGALYPPVARMNGSTPPRRCKMCRADRAATPKQPFAMAAR